MEEIFTLSFLAGLLGNILTAPIGEQLTKALTPNSKAELTTYYNNSCRKVVENFARTEGLTPTQVIDISDTMQQNYHALYQLAVFFEASNHTISKTALALQQETNIAWEGIDADKALRIIECFLIDFVPTFYEEIQTSQQAQIWITLLKTHHIQKMVYQTQLSQQELKTTLAELVLLLQKEQITLKQQTTNFPKRKELLDLLKEGDFPNLFLTMDSLGFTNNFMYNRLKHEQLAGFGNGIQLWDFKDRMVVYVNTYVKE